jgi:hypothetical protein
MGGQIRGDGQEARRSAEGVAGTGAEHGQHLIESAVDVCCERHVKGICQFVQRHLECWWLLASERAMEPLFSIELTTLPTITLSVRR